MSFEKEDICRLCANDQNLISLNSGKVRNMRGHIREMIQELLPIQIQWKDASVCFNCSIDVSNFYVFKLDILQKHKNLENLQPHVPVAKRPKLDNVDDSKNQPSIEDAEAVIKWLESKRAKLESKMQKELSVVHMKYDVATQYDVVETAFKECQTSNPELVNSASQCDKNEINSPLKVSGTSKSRVSSKEGKSSSKSKISELANKKHELTPKTKTPFHEKSHHTNNNIKLVSQVGDNINSLKERSDTTNVKDNCSQTVQTRLTRNLFQNSVVTEPCTQDVGAQTEKLDFINRRTQCDILKLNGFKNNLLQSKEIVSYEEGKQNKIADPQSFTNALLYEFDNTFLSKATQTDIAVSQCDVCKFSSNYLNLTTKESYLTSPIQNSNFVEDINKLDIKVTFTDKLKEEKISPSESLTIFTKMPENNGLLSPQSSDLLQVNNSKTDQVKICKLCDKTLYNKTEVTKHSKTHMQCNICRRKFRSLKATQAHINDCKVKLISISPFVSLVRIDKVSEIREKYFKPIEH